MSFEISKAYMYMYFQDRTFGGGVGGGLVDGNIYYDNSTKSGVSSFSYSADQICSIIF